MAEVDAGCRSAGIGCVDCKKWLLESLLPAQAHLRERREAVLADPTRVDEAIAAGNSRAKQAAGETLELVRSAMKLAPHRSPLGVGVSVPALPTAPGKGA